MPKKNKKSKSSTDTTNLKNKGESPNESKSAPRNEPKLAVNSTDKLAKNGLCLPLDKKLKNQLKRQKKKEKKLALNPRNRKTSEESNASVNVGQEIAKENCESTEANEARVDNSVQNCKVKNIDGFTNGSNTLQTTEEKIENKSLVQSLQTSGGGDNKLWQNESVRKENTFQKKKGKISVETIPEDLFEEFIQNEEIVGTNEIIKSFPGLSPNQSPNSSRKRFAPETMSTLSPVLTPSPPKIFYSYHGMTYIEPNTQPAIMEKNTSIEHSDEADICLRRRLEVIQEESSDFSDTSGHFEKRGKPAISQTKTHGNDNFHIYENLPFPQEGSKQIQKVYVYDWWNEKKRGVEIGAGQEVELEPTDSESEGEYVVNEKETSNEISESNRASDKEIESSKTEDGLYSNREMVDFSENSTWSVKSISSVSTKPLEEESESWRSSIDRDICGGSEADVESELESQRAFIFETCDDILSFQMDNFVPEKTNDGIEIFITNYKTGEYFNLNSEQSEKHFLNPLPSPPCCESTSEDFIQKNFPIIDINKSNQETEVENCLASDTSTADDVASFKNNEIIPAKVNVKSRAEAIRNEIDKMLLSKLKLVKSLEESNISENSWTSVLGNANNQMKNRHLNQKVISDSSSYENITKSNKKIIPVVEIVPNSPQNPEALSNLAEKKILTLPYGKLLLKKIGLGRCCFNALESETDCEKEMYVKSASLQNEQHPSTDSPVPSDVSVCSVLIGTSNKSVNNDEKELNDSRSYVEFDCGDSRIGQTEKWYGTRTAVPALLLGLSPSQRKVYEEKFNRFMPDEAEAASLIDLHQKFLERRSYSELNTLSKCMNLIYESRRKRESAVTVTEMKEFEKIPEKSAESPTQNNEGHSSFEKLKEEKMAKDTAQSTNKFESSPKGSLKKKSVGNEKSKSKGNLIKQNRCIEDREQGKNELKAEEGKKIEIDDRSNEESEAVGKSCLLAILQNAISDNFVPELKKDSSIKSPSESHEVFSVQNQDTMLNSWQNNPIFRYASSDEEKPKKNSFEEGRKTFERIWSKEKNLTTGETRMDGKIRPKTICCGKDSELFVNEPAFEKKVANVNNVNKSNLGETENFIITENLPAVSDVIKSFEKPKTKPVVVTSENDTAKTKIQIDTERYHISKRGDIAFIQNYNEEEKKKALKEKRKSMPASLLSAKEKFKQKMYDEYMKKLAERTERRQKKVIKVSQSNEFEGLEESKFFDLEDEFIKKVKERREKHKIVEGSQDFEKRKNSLDALDKKCQEFTDYWKGEISNLENERIIFYERDEAGDKMKDGGTESSNSKRSSIQFILDTSSDVDSLPKHLQELLQVDEEEFPDFIDGIWSPTQKVSVEETVIKEENPERKKLEDEPIQPVWTPKSAQASPVLEKKEFRPVNFESPILSRKSYTRDEKRESSVPPPWQQPESDKFLELAKSPSSPALSLPKAPNPTVTLLQKAREGHLPRGAHYLSSEMTESSGTSGSLIERLEIVSSGKSESDRPRKVEIAPKKIIGIGPTTKEGIPLVLRSEVTDENREKWYKRMYDSLHKAGNDDDYVTVKYRTSPSRKDIYGYQHVTNSGYQSEPESLSYDLSSNKYVTLDRRRAESVKENDTVSVTLPRSRASPPRRDFISSKNQPGRIEDYEPGRSSISELEANKWWDEVLEIFDREEERSVPITRTRSAKSFTNYASGYISDPQYVYKRAEDELQSPPSPEEQKEAYRIIQKGGEIPLKGLRKPAPERPKDNLETEIEYFPLSSTLTRIRVHKQNITPLYDVPFYLKPFLYQGTTLNFPTLPFGVCSSYSQVQLFPSYSQSQFGSSDVNSSNKTSNRDLNLSKKDQKFSVRLQNISSSNDYVRIVPKPRNFLNKSPIYVNLPLTGRSCSPDFSNTKEKCQDEVNKSKDVLPKQVEEIASDDLNKSRTKKSELTTFSDLKRVAPSIISTSGSNICLEELNKKTEQRNSSVSQEKEKKSTNLELNPESSNLNKITNFIDKGKENTLKKQILTKPLKTDKTLKKEISVNKCSNRGEKKIKKNVKKLKLPLSESTQREKPLSKTSKRFKSSSENSTKKKGEIKKLFKDKIEDSKKSKKSTTDSKKVNIEYSSGFVESESNVNGYHLKLKSSEDLKREIYFGISEEEEFEDVTMSSIYESLDRCHTPKPKVDADMTEVFRSRSFSPDVRRKIFKLPDMNKPVPPKRKQSKNSPTLKMWSKMRVSYPNHRSRLEEFGSNVKFLQDKIKRKLQDDKDIKPEFGDDIETVRTVKKNKNGEMSIKTNRYVRLARPASSGSLFSMSASPNTRHQRLLSEPRIRYESSENAKSPVPGETSKANQIVESEPKRASSKEKGLGTAVRSSTTYSVKSPARQEDERNSLKVTVAISSKRKEQSAKTTGLPLTKKGSVSIRSLSSPCPSGSSYRSNLSGKSQLSDKGSTSSQETLHSPQNRFLSPNSLASRISSPSRSASPGSFSSRSKTQKLSSDPKISTRNITGSPTAKPSYSKPTVFKSTMKPKEVPKSLTSAKKLSTLKSRKNISQKEELEKKAKKDDQKGFNKSNVVVPKKTRSTTCSTVDKEKNEIMEGRDLVRTDSFFQNLFLRAPADRRPTMEVERMSSVLERARMYQRRINWPETYKSEPSLSLVTYYLNQKRPVSFSKFKRWDRDIYPSRLYSPLGSLHSENFQMKLKRFDSMNQLGDVLYRECNLDGKERSSSEPPLRRPGTNFAEEKYEAKPIRISRSEASSTRSSPSSSRSPSCRRIKSYKTTLKPAESFRSVKKLTPRARSAGDVEEIKSKSNLHRDLADSTSSLNLSNHSDHTEYQAYILELMHSTQKCERFRELYKFYSNLEKLEKLERTASTGDLCLRLKNEEIIDFDRWKKIRTKERAKAELKALVENLMQVQKERNLLFRAADVEAVRWKGDRGLRIKERSVEDLKDQFNKYSADEVDSENWRKDLDGNKDNYKSLWKGNSIIDITSNLNQALMSYRGRPITLEEVENIKKANAKIGKEYGYSLKAWSSLSNEQVNLLKDQLNEIYTQDIKKKQDDRSEGALEKYEILVPKDAGIKSPGESSLHVRCNSALSKNQTYTPTIKRKENIKKEWKKAESISALPLLETNEKKISLPQIPLKEEMSSKLIRSCSETRNSKEDRHPVLRSKSTLSKPLSEDEKKRLSMTLSREVIEKMTKSTGKAPVLPRETLGALAAAGSKVQEAILKTKRTLSKADKDLVPVLTPKQKSKLEKLPKEKKTQETFKRSKANLTTEMESGSGSSETSIKTVIRKNSVDVLRKVQYFEDLHQSTDDFFDSELLDESKDNTQKILEHSEPCSGSDKVRGSDINRIKKGKQLVQIKKKNILMPSSSLENINDYFGQHKQYEASALSSKLAAKSESNESSKSLIPLPSVDALHELKKIFDDKRWLPLRHHSSSPVAFRNVAAGSSNESLFSYRSRSISPDPTKYYRAYLRMVKCGAVRKLCNKFESWEDLLSLSSDKDFWLPPAPRRFASDPELTRDMLRRFGTDPTKVTIRGQEVGDVRWLRTKFEQDFNSTRGRSRFRRARSPVSRSPITASARYMPRINVISKKAELQLQGLDHGKCSISPTRIHELPASPEGYDSLIDYTKDHGGYYFSGEVEKLKRKFERLQESERLSILGQMYTSTPDVNELRDIAPYLECAWVAHRHPGEFKPGLSPEPQPPKKRETSKKVQPKPRPRSSSPIRTKQPLSILKQSCPPGDRNIFADQKFDPSIHRPKYRYQPEREVDRRFKRSDAESWRPWNKPTVTFKEPVDFKIDPQFRDLSPDSPRKYVESEVTIHYKSPVRSEAKVMLSEDELARRQAESMKRIYKEERRRKYLQELQDMNSRRHTDNFTPSQKSPIPLNRYDDFPIDCNIYYSKGKDYSVDPVLVARGLYDFVGRRPRELAFRRGDIIFILRRLDKNWCEGELNGVVGLFPLSYVEVIPYNEINMKFGRARAKYDFVPQTSLELSAHKGDMIILIRKIDENWFEGRIGDRTGIIPVSYCHVLAMPQASRIPIRSEKISKPVAAPAAHSLIHDGSGISSKHYYAPYLSSPTSPSRSTVSSASANYHNGHMTADMLIDEALMQLDEEFDLKRSNSKPTSQPLNIRINPRPEPALYQVLFNHVPNNDDELELIQGETVTVVEKCGDGWYIGSKTSDGKLGIFPGTHVRRIAPEFV